MNRRKYGVCMDVSRPERRVYTRQKGLRVYRMTQLSRWSCTKLSFVYRRGTVPKCLQPHGVPYGRKGEKGVPRELDEEARTERRTEPVEASSSEAPPVALLVMAQLRSGRLPRREILARQTGECPVLLFFFSFLFFARARFPCRDSFSPLDAS